MTPKLHAHKVHQAIKKQVDELDRILDTKGLSACERENLSSVLNRLNLAAFNLRFAFGFKESRANHPTYAELCGKGARS